MLNYNQGRRNLSLLPIPPFWFAIQLSPCLEKSRFDHIRRTTIFDWRIAAALHCRIHLLDHGRGISVQGKIMYATPGIYIADSIFRRSLGVRYMMTLPTSSNSACVGCSSAIEERYQHIVTPFCPVGQSCRGQQHRSSCR